jgi:hypothetical protein
VNYELQITNPIIVNELDIIEQLTIAAEQAGANLAPTYQEYMHLPSPLPKLRRGRTQFFSPALQSVCEVSAGRR